jgi:hypothetical protein
VEVLFVAVVLVLAQWAKQSVAKPPLASGFHFGARVNMNQSQALHLMLRSLMSGIALDVAYLLAKTKTIRLHLQR